MKHRDCHAKCSAIYVGEVTHRRFTPKAHSFRYALFMLGLDVHEMELRLKPAGLFGFSWFNPLRFVEKDYLKCEPGNLSSRIKNKVIKLGGKADIKSITMMCQVRCFGIYFSPANFYFCYDNENNCTQMLAEVSNTPWNERHYYLVDLLEKSVNEKVFHVSPFLELNTDYHWRVKAPKKLGDGDIVTNSNVMINIKNIIKANKGGSGDSLAKSKVFDATLLMRVKHFNTVEVLKAWCLFPVMTLKIVAAIYWQAMRLFLKKVPFVGHPKLKD